MNKRSLFLIFFVELSILLHINKGEYRVYSRKVPSSMNSVFKSVKEDIFPADLNIKMSLTKTDGMLLYSIDRHSNQLHVSLKKTIPAAFVIDLNGQKSYFTLAELCRCEHCLYEILDLQIYIRDSTMYLSCNDGDTKIVKCGPDKHVNKGYPMPYSQSKINGQGPNEAHLWLLNFLPSENMSPKGDQLSGCIFNVSYNNQEIIFTNITDNIGRGCTKTCIGDICNGGQCYETYNTVPFCNCTMTFKNGLYCNDTIKSVNARSLNQVFNFVAFKLSWNGSGTDIMRLENKNVLLRTYIRDGILYMEYQHKTTIKTYITGLMGNNHKVGMEYIMIGIFYDTYVDIQIHNNGSWYHDILKTENNLSKELFDSLELRSGDGVIDLVIKHSPDEYTWTRIEIRDVIKLDGSSSHIKNTPYVSTNTSNIVTAVLQCPHTRENYILMALLVLCLIIVSVFVIICIRRRIKRIKKIKSDALLSNVRFSNNDQEVQTSEGCPQSSLDQESDALLSNARESEEMMTDETELQEMSSEGCLQSSLDQEFSNERSSNV